MNIYIYKYIYIWVFFKLRIFLLETFFNSCLRSLNTKPLTRRNLKIIHTRMCIQTSVAAAQRKDEAPTTLLTASPALLLSTLPTSNSINWFKYMYNFSSTFLIIHEMCRFNIYQHIIIYTYIHIYANLYKNIFRVKENI